MDNIEIFGKFDGESMWGNDNKIYAVPENYASKSRLVEGDELKLMITDDGQYIFKQIKPADRRRVLGRVVLSKDQRHLMVEAENRLFRLLRSSTTFFKAKVGEAAIIVIPRDGKPTWAALDSIIRERDADDVEL